jgi:hypothetical protein
MRLLIQKALDSFRVLKENYKVLWVGIVVEILFLFTFGFFTGPLRNGIGNNLLNLGDIIVGNSENLQDSFFDVILGSMQFRNILLLGMVLAFIVYILYCIFQGFMWKYSMSLNGEKKSYLPYIKKFFLVNSFWYILFLIYIIIDFFVSYVDLVAQRIDNSGAFLFSRITNIMLLVILYFAFISYIILDKHSSWKSIVLSFKLGLKKFWVIILGYVFISVLLIMANYILILASNLHIVFVILLGIFIVIPLLIWARIFLTKVVKQYEKV